MAWLQVNPRSQLNRVKPPEPVATESTLKPAQQSLGTFRSGSLPNVAAPQATNVEPENTEVSLIYRMWPLSFDYFCVPVVFANGILW